MQPFDVILVIFCTNMFFYPTDWTKIVKIYSLHWRFREIENSVNTNDKKIDLSVTDSSWSDQNKADFKGNGVRVNSIIISNKLCKNMSL